MKLSIFRVAALWVALVTTLSAGNYIPMMVDTNNFDIQPSVDGETNSWFATSHGELYMDGASNNVALTPQNTWIVCGNFQTNSTHLENMTVNATGMVFQFDGDYQGLASISAESQSPNKIVLFSFFNGSNRLIHADCERKFGTANDVGNCGIVSMEQFTAGDTVTLRALCTNSTTTLTLREVTWTMLRVSR